jgi:hypothetical protein
MEQNKQTPIENARIKNILVAVDALKLMLKNTKFIEEDFEHPSVLEAIIDLHSNEHISSILNSLVFTQEDRENRKVISDAVAIIPKGKIKIKL